MDDGGLAQALERADKALSRIERALENRSTGGRDEALRDKVREAVAELHEVGLAALGEQQAVERHRPDERDRGRRRQQQRGDVDALAATMARFASAPERYGTVDASHLPTWDEHVDEVLDAYDDADARRREPTEVLP